MSQLKKPIKTLLLIAILLAIIAGLLSVFYKNKDSENDTSFYTIDYDSISALENQEKPYYLLACDLHESQCQNIIKLLRKENNLKYDVYYLDTASYSEVISNQELSDDERMSYILLFKEHMGKFNISSIPSFQLRSNGKALGVLGDFLEEGYAELTRNELTSAIKQLNKVIENKAE